MHIRTARERMMVCGIAATGAGAVIGLVVLRWRFQRRSAFAVAARAAKVVDVSEFPTEAEQRKCWRVEEVLSDLRSLGGHSARGHCLGVPRKHHDLNMLSDLVRQYAAGLSDPKWLARRWERIETASAALAALLSADSERHLVLEVGAGRDVTEVTKLAVALGEVLSGGTDESDGPRHMEEDEKEIPQAPVDSSWLARVADLPVTGRALLDFKLAMGSWEVPLSRAEKIHRIIMCYDAEMMASEPWEAALLDDNLQLRTRVNELEARVVQLESVIEGMEAQREFRVEQKAGGDEDQLAACTVQAKASEERRGSRAHSEDFASSFYEDWLGDPGMDGNRAEARSIVSERAWALAQDMATCDRILQNLEKRAASLPWSSPRVSFCEAVHCSLTRSISEGYWRHWADQLCDDCCKLTYQIEQLAADALELGCKRIVPGAMDVFAQATEALERIVVVIQRCQPSARRAAPKSNIL